MIEWLKGLVERKKNFALRHEIFMSQNDAESWGLLVAVRSIDTGKADTEAFVTDAETLLLPPSIPQGCQPFTVNRRLEFPATTQLP